MDSMTLIAIASIVMAGLTTGFGTMGPALAEGKAVSDGVDVTGATARRLSHYYANSVCRFGNDRIHSDLLFRYLDDFGLCQSVLESCHRRCGRKLTHAY